MYQRTSARSSAEAHLEWFGAQHHSGQHMLARPLTRQPAVDHGLAVWLDAHADVGESGTRQVSLQLGDAWRAGHSGAVCLRRNQACREVLRKPHYI
jgi:hypothetical protein